jgi:hypothetical protein
MTLAARGYRTKRELKAAVGQPLQYEETSMFGPEYRPDGDLYLVGPSPTVRKWWAKVTMRDGHIARVS